MEIKITPFILFLILLITLVISILFGNSFLFKKEKEGFVSYGYSTPDAESVYIPQYSKDSNKKVIKLYDNLYFDGLNGNIVEVDSTYCGNVRVNGSSVSGNVSCNDPVGLSISHIYITNRSGNTVTYSTIKNKEDINKQSVIEAINTNESNASLVPSNTQYSYLTRCPTLSTVENYKYQLFYVSWENDTYMHLIGLDPTAISGNNIRSFYYKMNDNKMRYVDFTNLSYIPQYSQTYLSNDDTNNGKMYKDTVYNENVYQISKYVKYDIAHGYVLVLNPSTNTYTIYNRSSGATVQNLSSGLVENLTSFVSWCVSDNNNGMLLVMAYGVYTMIAIVNSVQNNRYYNLSHCVRFTDTDVHPLPGGKASTVIASHTVDVSMNPVAAHCFDELSCKWYYYFKTMGSDPSVLFSNDYIRKTQVVPPVCPTCPSCPSTGVCTDCGGSGGSGTQDTSNNEVTTEETTTTEQSSSSGSGDGNGDGNGGGVVGLGKEIVGGTVNLGREIVGGTVNLGKQAIGGLLGVMHHNRQDRYRAIQAARNQENGQAEHGFLPSTSHAYLDQYSYYGALKPKGDNFMPVTADFSSFRK